MTKTEAAKNPKFAVSVKLFGVFREALCRNHAELNLAGGATVADLRNELYAVYPEFSTAKTYLIVTVNRHVAPDSAQITKDDEVAVMPLVSGG